MKMDQVYILHTCLVVGICHTGLWLCSSDSRCSVWLLVVLLTVVSYSRSCGPYIRV